MTIRIERRLNQPRWLKVAVPLGSLVVAFVLIAILLVATGRDPVSTYKRPLRGGVHRAAGRCRRP